MGSRDEKMAFNERPLTLDDQVDNVVARQFIQDDTVATKSFTRSIDEL